MVKQQWLKHWVLGWVVMLFMGAAPVGAAVTLQVDRNPVVAGEPFNLSISVAGHVSASPDFSPLQRDFHIMGTNQRTDVKVVNGEMQQKTTWEVTLFAREAGALEIPALRVNNERTEPVKLTAEKNTASANSAQSGNDVLIELEMDTQTPYVQQQVLLTQRLLYAVPFLPNQASMTHPDWRPGRGKGMIQQLGNVQRFTTTRQGRHYDVIERRYAIFPQNSGDMLLDHTVFTGVMESAGSGSFTDPFGLTGQRIRRSSKPLSLQVQPQPNTQTDHWLPAQSLTLNAYWEPDEGELQAGEPVQLTLAIVAEGLMAEQLPPLSLEPPNGIKAYSSDVNLRNDTGGDSVIGVREEQWVIIGTADGKFQLPEITLDWWNVTEQRMETAMVPAKELRVSGAGGIVGAVTPPESQRQRELQAEQTAKALREQQQSHTPSLTEVITGETERVEKAANASRWWQWGAALALLLLAGIAACYWWWQRAFRVPPSKQSKHKYTTGAEMAPIKRLQLACEKNNAPAALQALQAYLQAELQLKPPTLAQLRAQANGRLQQALDELDASLYGANPDDWQGGKRLWSALLAWQKQRSEQQAAQNNAPHSGLIALYPD